MTLQSSGAISLSDIKTEFGLRDNPISLNDSRINIENGTINFGAEGEASFSDYRGKTEPMWYSTTTTNTGLYTIGFSASGKHDSMYSVYKEASTDENNRPEEFVDFVVIHCQEKATGATVYAKRFTIGDSISVEDVSISENYIYMVGTYKVSTNEYPFIAQFDPEDGTLNWIKKYTDTDTDFDAYPGSGFELRLCRCVHDSSDNLYVTVSQKADGDGAGILKVSSSGALSFAKQLSNSDGLNMKRQSDFRIPVAINSGATAIYVLTGEFIVSLNSSGTVTAHKQFSFSDAYSDATFMEVDSFNFVHVLSGREVVILGPSFQAYDGNDYREAFYIQGVDSSASGYGTVSYSGLNRLGTITELGLPYSIVINSLYEDPSGAAPNGSDVDGTGSVNYLPIAIHKYNYFTDSHSAGYQVGFNQEDYRRDTAYTGDLKGHSFCKTIDSDSDYIYITFQTGSTSDDETLGASSAKTPVLIKLEKDFSTDLGTIDNTTSSIYCKPFSGNSQTAITGNVSFEFDPDPTDTTHDISGASLSTPTDTSTVSDFSSSITVTNEAFASA